MSKIEIKLKNQLEDNIRTHQSILKISRDIIEAIKNIQKKLKKGGKLLICGNGGSAADAQHLAAEFIVRLRPHINRMPIPAITLAQDTSTITACGNDYSFDDIFLRSFQALAKRNDILLCISTSGNSKNIINVIKVALKKKIDVLCFLGKGGGAVKKIIKEKKKLIVVPSKDTARIQECHIFLGHVILNIAENTLIKKKFVKNKNFL